MYQSDKEQEKYQVNETRAQYEVAQPYSTYQDTKEYYSQPILISDDVNDTVSEYLDSLDVDPVFLNDDGFWDVIEIRSEDGTVCAYELLNPDTAQNSFEIKISNYKG